MFTIFRQELRLSLRQRSYYTFFILFFIMIFLIFILQANMAGMQEYTNKTGTMMNVILYLLPLVALLLGSFSFTQEKEDGRFTLLLTYPLSFSAYTIGKYAGQFAAQWVVVTLSFGAASLLSVFFKLDLSVKWFLLLYLFSILLLFCFLSMAILIGTCASTRWQALMTSIAVWFLFIMAWPLLVISLLSLLPYSWIQPGLIGLTLLNPAEWLRIMFTIQFGGGAVFGQPYYQLVDGLKNPLGSVLFITYCLLFAAFILYLSVKRIERNRLHE